MEKVLIITGGSKGIGSGIVTEYLKHNYYIISISRSKDTTEAPSNLIELQADLSETEQLERVTEDVFGLLKNKTIQQITLINNAGTLGKISALENITDEDIARTVSINTVAPMILISQFIRRTTQWNCKKKIINITSGAATKPYHGWAVYCTTKAALDMVTKTVALEESTKENGVTIIGISPGVVDTNMQTEIRQTNLSDFKDIDRFMNYKKNGELKDITLVGQLIYTIDNANHHESGSIINLSEFIKHQRF